MLDLKMVKERDEEALVDFGGLSDDDERDMESRESDERSIPTPMSNFGGRILDFRR